MLFSYLVRVVGFERFFASSSEIVHLPPGMQVDVSIAEVQIFSKECLTPPPTLSPWFGMIATRDRTT